MSRRSVIVEINENIENYCNRVKDLNISEKELTELKHIQDNCFKLARELGKKIKAVNNA